MLKITVSVLLAASLAACGGGGGGAASDQGISKSSAAPRTPFSAPVLFPENATKISPSMQAPPVSAKAATLAGASINMSSDHQEFVVKSAVASALQLTGASNAGWIADGQKMAAVSINGTLNTIVFRPGATASSLTVNAAGNTIYLPVGSPIKVEGPFAAQTAVYLYTP